MIKIGDKIVYKNIRSCYKYCIIRKPAADEIFSSNRVWITRVFNDGRRERGGWLLKNECILIGLSLKETITKRMLDVSN